MNSINKISFSLVIFSSVLLLIMTALLLKHEISVMEFVRRCFKVASGITDTVDNNTSLSHMVSFFLGYDSNKLAFIVNKLNVVNLL